MEQINSPFYKSKRFYVNVGAVVACLFPKSQSFIQQYLAESAAAWATINLILGFVSKGKIVIS